MTFCDSSAGLAADLSARPATTLAPPGPDMAAGLPARPGTPGAPLAVAQPPGTSNDPALARTEIGCGGGAAVFVAVGGGAGGLLPPPPPASTTTRMMTTRIAPP